LENKRVLDMGCGTAVLAILAKLKDSGYTEAIDIDDWAYNNSLENIGNNNCKDIIVKKGGAELLGENMFDIILANINRNILLNDMSSYVRVLDKGGRLLLSGFFSSDKEILMEEALKNKLTLCCSEQKDDWTLLHFIKE
jgi:ribosomal protein L11 methyltransferase